MSRRTHAARLIALSAASLILLTGCWTSTTSSSESSAAPTPGGNVPVTGAAVAPDPACPGGSPEASTYTCVGVTVTGAAGKEPTIALAEGFAPATELQVADVYPGSGTPVAATDTLTVHYVLVGQQAGKLIESSWPSGQPATFPLSGVITGWQEGLIGMQPGGRRLLVIPGSLAYGPEGRPPAIGEDETLVFVVDLVAATPA